MADEEKEYTLKISRLIVDKLGLKLYDRISFAIAELVSNSYDADAEHVTIRAPVGVYLAKKRDGKLIDKGYSITIEDDGHGMNPSEMDGK